ncbi:MAG: transcription antitermination factor NusB [Candidatus Babeliales bacterium]
MDNNASTHWFESLSQRDKRSLIFHLLYAADSYDYQVSLESLVDNLNRGFELNIPLDSQIVTTAQNIIDNREALDEIYKPLLANWRFERVGVCTKLILRYAIWEMHHTDTHSNIIINEAIELAKCFAEKDAYKFINGILDEALKQLPKK